MTSPAHASGIPVHRLIGFSDAVVAIAITLLVLPLIEVIPEDGGEDGALAVVVDHLPTIGCFLLSFAVIWRIWTVHHQVFARVERVSGFVAAVNTAWLACIVFLPVPVALVGSYGADPFVLALYVGVLCFSGAALTVMAVTLRRAARQRDSGPDRSDIERIAGNAVGLLLALVVVLAVPDAGFWPLLLLLLDGPVLALLHRYRRRRADPH
ncbi:DUF1211 domain-containing protein [Nakamurella sp. YIM 132087]|uniref:DUF1211 domain-containing protein n=1 Tax=Nakamurella alba TaxID=2665158 RepID=A0A7K1FFV1_9ACTN|nr:TMEM175 family protein [Nakamurella alba]MTD12349.1 DUF1211 domain-containing protein [Nakamurella alba]